MSYIIRVTGQPSVRPNVRIIRFERVPFAPFEYFIYVCNENYIIIVNECLVTDDTITICDVKCGKSCTPIHTGRLGKKINKKNGLLKYLFVKNFEYAIFISSFLLAIKEYIISLYFDRFNSLPISLNARLS